MFICFLYTDEEYDSVITHQPFETIDIRFVHYHITSQNTLHRVRTLINGDTKKQKILGNYPYKNIF